MFATFDPRRRDKCEVNGRQFFAVGAPAT